MDIQTVFFTLASIFMVLGILLMAAGIVLAIFIIVQLRRAERSVKAFKEKTERQFAKIAEQKRFFSLIPMAVAGYRWFQKRRQKK